MSERMLFCLGDSGRASKGAGYQKNNQIFNTQVTEKEWNEARDSLPDIKIQITKWVDKEDMTKEEKSNSSVWKEIGGYLKYYTYEEAWANWWEEASAKDRQAILDLPHFDGEIFTGITGITDFTTDRLKTVNIGGKEYKVTPELTKALKDLKEL